MRLTTKRLIFFSYFIVIFFLKRISVLSLSWIFLKYSFKDLIFWLTGALLGGYFIKLEQLAYVYFIQPQEPLSLEIKSLLRERRRAEVWRLLRERVGEQKLAFRSALFQAVWVVLAFFTLTSTVGVFGKTLVMAIGFHLLLDEWEDILGGRGLVWLFWQVKREVGGKEQKFFLWIMSGIFGILSLLLI